MLAGLTLGTEIKRFGRSRFTRAAVVVLAVLPLVYGALYLWAFWDPFGNVNKLPVALVNSDRGATSDGTRVTAGDDVARGLEESGALQWHTESPAGAAKGVAEGKYYFAVELPEDFSAAVASPTSGNPRKAQLKAYFNDANNYISTTIGRTALNEIRAAVANKISTAAVDQVLVGLLTAGDGVKQAADGAGKLATGAKDLDTGAQKLRGGAAELSGGIDQARDGSRTLAGGVHELRGGIDQATGGIIRLTDGLAQLNLGAVQLGDGAAALAAGVERATAPVAGVQAAQQTTLTQLDGIIAQLRANPATAQAARDLQRFRDTQIANGPAATTLAQLATLRDGAQRLSANLAPGSPLRNGLNAATSGGGELRDGLLRLQSGAAQLDDGAATLATGLVKLSDGGHQLRDGTVELAKGSTQLKDGSAELATKLREGAGSVPTWDDGQRQQIAAVIGGPVDLASTHENAAPNFGTGMAPFFLSLALFFGGVVIWMTLRPLQTRPIAAGINPLRIALSSYLPAVLIAVAQSVILYAVVRWALGLEPRHPIGMLAFMLLASLSFVALVQAINALLGPTVGRVTTLALLMLQLVSSGGMYPVETTSRFFQILHPFDPLSYGVNGLRQLVMGGVDERLWISVIVLIGIWAGSLTVTTLSARRNRQWNLMRLLPPITT